MCTYRSTVCAASQSIPLRSVIFLALVGTPVRACSVAINHQGVIQRSYNAYAVRVQDSSSPPTPGGGLGGLPHGGDKGAGTLKIVPAGQTTEGVLCIEMRIRLYHDGAMSKILEKLAKVGFGWSVVFLGM